MGEGYTVEWRTTIVAGLQAVQALNPRLILLDVLSVSVGCRQVLRQVLNLKPVHHQVLRLLGSQVERCDLLAA